MELSTFVFALIALFVLFAIVGGFKVVQQSECMVVERLGRYNATLTSGFNIIIPFIDQPRRVSWLTNGFETYTTRIDLRETVLDIPEQSVITRDNVSIKIDALLYIQITDALKASYEISNLPTAVTQLAQTSLRNVIGEMDLDQTLASRDTINSKLKLILDEATDKWGTKVNRVELRNITPPKEIQNAMEKQMQAERERRAKVLEAEGDKQARIARSEGMRQEQINLAEGDKEAKVRQAEGEARAIVQVADAKKQAIEMIKQSLGSANLTTQYLVATNYIDTLGEFSQKPGDKVYIPYESSIALGGMGSIAEIIKGTKLSS